eukprot:g16740.t1
MFMLVEDVALFPSLTGWGHGPLVAMENWPEAERDAFAVAASGKILMLALWAAWMLYMIAHTGCMLRKLPYVPTRFHQLVHRLFSLQGVFLAVVSAVLALVRLVKVLHEPSPLGGPSAAAEFFLLVVKAREDHVGSLWVYCAFVLQLLLLFMPASVKGCAALKDIAVRFEHFDSHAPSLQLPAGDTVAKDSTAEQQHGLLSLGSAGRGRNEGENEVSRFARRTGDGGGGVAVTGSGDTRKISPDGGGGGGGDGGGKRKEGSGTDGASTSVSGSSSAGGNNPAAAAAGAAAAAAAAAGVAAVAPAVAPAARGERTGDRPVFCVETAAWLLEVAEESYRDPPNPNPTVYGRDPTDVGVAVADFGRMGLEVVSHIFDSASDTHCFVLKDEPRARLVVAFRGSVCRRLWLDKLRFMQTELNLDKMMPAGRESEAPKVLTEDIEDMDILEPWPPAKAAAPLGKVGRIGIGIGGAPAQTGAGAAAAAPGAGAPIPAAATRGGSAVSLVAGSASGDAFAAAPSATTENEHVDNDNDDGGGHGQDGAMAGAAATGNLTGRGIFFFPRSASSIPRGESAAAGESAPVLGEGEEGHAVVVTPAQDGGGGGNGVADGGAGASPTPVVAKAGTVAGAGAAAFAAAAGVDSVHATAGTAAAASKLARSASADGFTASPSATTDNEHGVGSGGNNAKETAIAGAPATVRRPARSRFFSSKRARNAHSTDPPLAAGDRGSRSPVTAGEGMTATGAVAADGAALGKNTAGRRQPHAFSNPGFGREETSGWFYGRKASSAPIAATSASGEEDDEDIENQRRKWASTGGGGGVGVGAGKWASTGGGGVGAGLGATAAGNSGKRVVSPRALSLFGMAGTRRATSMLDDDGEGGGDGGGSGSESTGRRSQKGRAAGWFGKVLKSASSIGLMSFDDGGGVDAFDDVDDEDDDDASDDFESEDGGEGAKLKSSESGQAKELVADEEMGARGKELSDARNHFGEVRHGSIIEWLNDKGEAPLSPGLLRRRRRVLGDTGAVMKKGRGAADRSARTIGLHKIPLLKECVWGQVHSGIWDSYEAVREELHVTVRKTVVDWLQSRDRAPDIKIYVTGHSMGGALANHCALDLQLHTIDKIQARLGLFVQMRRIRRQGAPSLSLPQPPRDHQPRQQQQPPQGGTGRHLAEAGATGVDAKSGSAAAAAAAIPVADNDAGGGKATAALPPKLDSATGRGPAFLSLETPTSCRESITLLVAKAAAAKAGPTQGDGDGDGDGDNASSSSSSSNGGAAGAGRPNRMLSGLRRMASNRPFLFNSSSNGDFDGSPAMPPGIAAAAAAAVSNNSARSSFSRWSFRRAAPAPALAEGGSRGAGDTSGGGAGDKTNGDGGVLTRGSVELSMFSFGAPRAGNARYAAKYKAAVPRSFRVVVDGDPVPGLPTWWYGHAGTKVLIDGQGRGSLVLDPSVAEQRVFPRSERRRYVHHHDTGRYREGLRGSLLQAVPPEVAIHLPSHWPFARPAPTVATNDGHDDYPAAFTDDHGSYLAASKDDLGSYPAASTDDLGSYPAASTDDLGSYPAASTDDPAASTDDLGSYPAASKDDLASYPAASKDDLASPPALSNTTPATAVTSTTSTTGAGRKFNPSSQETKVSQESDGVEQGRRSGAWRPAIIPSFSTFDSGSRHSSNSSNSSGSSGSGGDADGDIDGVNAVIGGSGVIGEAVEAGNHHQQQTEGRGGT